MKNRLTAVFLACAFAAAAGCGGGGNDAGDTLTGQNVVAITIPSDVVMSSPTASTAGSTALSKGQGFKILVGDPVARDFTSKKEALEALIAGEGECAFTLDMPDITEPACYGPIVKYTNHPDSGGGGGPDSPNGSLPVGDTGLWDETEGNEACAAAKMNALIDKVASKVDNMVSMFASMACAGKKAGVELPAVGDTLDVASAMTTHSGIPGLTITSATIERLADDSDGNPVYLSTIETTMEFARRGITNNGKIVLKHIPTSSDNSTYKGKIATIMWLDNAVQGCGGVDIMQEGDGAMAGTILYEKNSADSIVYEVNFADFCGENVDPFDDDYNIAPADKSPSGEAGGWVHNWNYGLFSLNPENGTGNVAYAWQAGAADGRTRVLNVSVSASDDSSASGTAYYGFGPDAEDPTLGAIDGFVCNWAGPGGAITVGNAEGRSAGDLLAAGIGVSKAQKQTLTRAAGAAEFTPTSSKIRYAPQNKCGVDAGDGFIYNAIISEDNQTPLNLDNDRTTDDEGFGNNLVDLSSVDFVMPAAPADVF